MDKAKEKLIQSWLNKSQRDLTSAKKLISNPEPLLDTAIYHCQQSAEKAFKAFLVLHDVEFEKTHNLNLLLEFCMEKDNDFRKFSDTAADLTPYATAYRYPDEFFESEPSEEQVKLAIQLAEQLHDFVSKKLSTIV